MKATRLMSKAKTRDEIANTPRFDPQRVEALVLDELNMSRTDMINDDGEDQEVRLARVVIASIITDHCGKPGRSENACRAAIAKQIGMKSHTSRADLHMAIASNKLHAAAQGMGFKSARMFEAYIVGMLELVKGETHAA